MTQVPLAAKLLQGQWVEKREEGQKVTKTKLEKNFDLHIYVCVYVNSLLMCLVQHFAIPSVHQRSDLTPAWFRCKEADGWCTVSKFKKQFHGIAVPGASVCGPKNKAEMREHSPGGLHC